tara:strand:- start:939 stop:1145 length:207 start_codon:yes stop_codon:yes gene_type:complete
MNDKFKAGDLVLLSKKVSILDNDYGFVLKKVKECVYRVYFFQKLDGQNIANINNNNENLIFISPVSPS